MNTLRNTMWTAVGLLGLATLVAMPSAADQVILDDLIVDGSLCVGNDCVNGESFGFDTIRLKENNLRIKAQDTSNSASFPTQDWQLTFNDSVNGGLNKFSIDAVAPDAHTPFTIESAARTHALYVEGDGDIGIGTNNPVLELHVVRGDSPGLRLEQDGSSGFNPQTWDVVGNEANFFIRDVTNGSKLPFRIKPNARGNAIYIQADGSVEFAGETDAGDADLHVMSGATQDAIIGLGVGPDFNDGNSNAMIFGYNGNGEEGRGFIGTRPTEGSGDLQFNIKNVLQMSLTSEGLHLESTCIELDTLACTASAGGGFGCVVGSCP